jgi:UPF0755 protein
MRARRQPESSEDQASVTAREQPTATSGGEGPERRAGRLDSSLRKRIGALVALAFLAALVVFLVALFQPLHGRGHGEVIVEIPHGASAGRIGSILAAKGVVSSGALFQLRALLEGRRGDLHPGRYKLELDMSYGAAIDVLAKGPPPAIVVRVVIPEGQTRREIAQTAAADHLAGDYMAASATSLLLDPAHYGAPRKTQTLEGFLFPATYELVAGAPVSRLVRQQLEVFKQRFGSTFRARARGLDITPYQLLTVASMVEGEAQLPRDRARVAAVIYNRLRLHMPLGIDATIRYALNDHTRPLTEAQLRSDSPYNTRTHPGLPPTPIGNPGMAGIEAAAHPAHVPYLYYVAGADGCGELVFSVGYSRFLANAAAYERALARNGGKVPTCTR